MKIKTFETTLSNPVPKFHETEIKTFDPPPPPSRNSGRAYKAKNREVYRHYFGELFENNEFLAYQRKALTNEQIQRTFLMKYKRNRTIRYRFETYRFTVGMFRNQYNKQLLYASQPAPYLLSFQYDETGYIVVGGNQANTYMSFEDCYQRCVELKVADPRFVPPELIVEIRNRQTELLTLPSNEQPNDGINWLEWIAPNEDLIKRLCTKLKLKELYNSVRFPRGWTREETPIED